MRILLTGARGLLGRKITRLCAAEGVELIATAADMPDLVLNGTIPETWDITNHEQIEGLITRYKPDAVIHSAAMTNVDACETSRDEAYSVNALAVRNLAFMCKVHGVRLVHLSTDFVFDGENGPYTEKDPVNPVNYYGHTKLESERFVIETDPSHVILRTVLIYGYEPGITRSNIVLWVKKSLEEGQEVKLVTDQFRTPTWAEDLAKGCLQAARSAVRGVFHVSGNDMMDMYTLGRKVAKHWNLDASLIKPVDSTQFTQPATRPLKTGLITTKAEAAFGYKPTPFAESLGEIAVQLKAL